MYDLPSNMDTHEKCTNVYHAFGTFIINCTVNLITAIMKLFWVYYIHNMLDMTWPNLLTFQNRMKLTVKCMIYSTMCFGRTVFSCVTKHEQHDVTKGCCEP